MKIYFRFILIIFFFNHNSFCQEVDFIKYGIHEREITTSNDSSLVLEFSTFLNKKDYHGYFNILGNDEFHQIKENESINNLDIDRVYIISNDKYIFVFQRIAFRNGEICIVEYDLESEKMTVLFEGQSPSVTSCYPNFELDKVFFLKNIKFYT